MGRFMINGNDITNFIKGGSKVQFIVCILTSIIVIIPDRTITILIGGPIYPTAKLVIWIFLAASILSIMWDLFIVGKFNKKERSMVYEELYKDFHSISMRSDMKRIKDWLSTHDVDAYVKQHKFPEERDTNFNDIDNSRAAITDRFTQIWEADEGGVLSKWNNDVKDLVPKGRVQFLLERIELIEKALEEDSSDKYNKPMFDFYRDLYKL